VIGDLRRAGHVPSLVAAFLHFETSFMCWVLLGALGIAISSDLGLSSWEKGLVVGLPLVAGSVFRLAVGSQVDRRSPRAIGTITLVVAAAALVLGWLGARDLPEMLVVGLLLGAAGASFAVALPLAGRAFEPRFRGLAMGIAGAGNSGTVLATLLAPRLAAHIGWHNVLGVAALPIVFVVIAFRALTRRTPQAADEAPRRSLRELLRVLDARSLSGIYLITFGGYVGSVSFLPIFLHDAYGASPGWAASATAVCAAAGSLLRPVGGYIGDRIRGEAVLPVVFAVAATALAGVASHPTAVGAVALFAVAVGALGAGNGAVFQIVPRVFPSDMGSVTGLVGAAGGLGGFLMPFGLGLLRSVTGSYVPGLAVFGAACLAGAAALVPASRRWRSAMTPSLRGAA
jgi:NNP family nitrate/nitrite transporter-like MFS transporter